jgi:hypothetical protein
MPNPYSQDDDSNTMEPLSPNGDGVTRRRDDHRNNVSYFHIDLDFDPVI